MGIEYRNSGDLSQAESFLEEATICNEGLQGYYEIAPNPYTSAYHVSFSKIIPTSAFQCLQKTTPGNDASSDCKSNCTLLTGAVCCYSQRGFKENSNATLEVPLCGIQNTNRSSLLCVKKLYSLSLSLPLSTKIVDFCLPRGVYHKLYH